MEASAEQVLRWHPFADVATMQRFACQRIVEAAASSIAEHGRFAIVLAGGNTPRAVYEMLRAVATDWSRWSIWFGDERCAPVDDPQRNSVMARTAWLDHVAIPNGAVHDIPSELGAEAAARSYADALHGFGDFDLVLLGLGEDGHTASLFPGHDCGTAADASDALAVFDAPKPPPQRVSLSATRLSRARHVFFLVEGSSKRNALALWRKGADIPARTIRPEKGVDVLTSGD